VPFSVNVLESVAGRKAFHVADDSASCEYSLYSILDIVWKFLNEPPVGEVSAVKLAFFEQQSGGRHVLIGRESALCK
jgi:hypothetical protein